MTYGDIYQTATAGFFVCLYTLEVIAILYKRDTFYDILHTKPLLKEVYLETIEFALNGNVFFILILSVLYPNDR